MPPRPGPPPAPDWRSPNTSHRDLKAESLTSARIPSARSLLLICLAILAGAAVLNALTAAVTESGADEDIFRYVGMAWQRGDLPYRDAVENKPPLVFLFWRLFWAAPLLGRWAGVLLTCVTAGLISGVAAALWDDPRARCAGPIALVALCSPSLGQPFGDTETIGGVFAIAAIWLVLGSKSVGLAIGRVGGAGCLVGLATLAKPVYGIEFLALLGLICLRTGGNQRPRLLLTALGSGLLPWAVMAAYFSSQGCLADFVRYGTGYLGAPGTSRSLHESMGVLPTILTARLASPAVMTVVVLGIVGLAQGRRRSKVGPTVLLCGGWAALVAAAILAQGWAWDHQFKQLILPLALLAGGAFAASAGQKETNPAGAVPVLALFGAALAVGAPLIGNVSTWRGWRAAGLPVPQPGVEVGLVTRVTGPEERIWGFPRHSLHLTAGRLSASRFFSPIFLGGPEVQAELFGRLEAGRAAAIFVDWPAVDAEAIDAPFAPALRPAFRARLEQLLRTRFDRAGEAGTWTAYRYRNSVTDRGER